MMDQSVLGYDKYEKRKRYPKESFYIQKKMYILRLLSRKLPLKNPQGFHLRRWSDLIQNHHG